MLEFYNQPCFLLPLCCSSGDFCVLNTAIEKNVTVSVQMSGKTKRKGCLVSGNKQTKKSGKKKKAGSKLSIATFLSDFEKHKMLSFNSASVAESPLINSRMRQEWQNWLQALPACGLIGH